MIIQKKEIYKCDVCGFESESRDQVKMLTVPGYKRRDTSFVPDLLLRDLCENCMSKLSNVVSKSFYCFVDIDGNFQDSPPDGTVDSLEDSPSNNTDADGNFWD